MLNYLAKIYFGKKSPLYPEESLIYNSSSKE